MFRSISIDGYFSDQNNGIAWGHAGRGEDAGFKRKQRSCAFILAENLSGDGGILAYAERELKASEGPDITLLGGDNLAWQLGKAERR